MKKILLIGVGFILAVAILGVAGYAYAQNQEPPDTQITDSAEFPYERGGWSRGTHGDMMGRQVNVVPGGMMGYGLDENEPGLLHDYLWPAVSEAFDLTEVQKDAFEIVRETIQDIRENLTQEEIRDKMKEAMTTAIDDALEDGAITQEQADSWLARMEQMEGVAPRVPFGGWDRAASFQQGFSRGVKFGHQMIVNHEYMDAAITDALDITVEELEELRSEEGFSWNEYATEELGLSEEEITALKTEISSNAVNAALEDGAITQEQADWVLERMENYEGRGGWFGQP